MHPFHKLCLISSCLAFAGACSTSPERAKSGDLAVSSATQTAMASGQGLKQMPPFPVEKLRAGMPGAEIEALFGPPQSIEPVAADPERARVWVYQRLLGTEIKEVPAGTREVPVWTGPGQQESIKMVKELILRKQQTTFTELTRLLVYDGKYVEKTQQVDRAEKFVD